MNSKQAPYPAWIYRQSAALPYRWHDGHLEVLLVTSRRGKRWILPKGIVEPGLTAAQSAAKEAREEAGVVGETAEEAIGSYRYGKWGGSCEVVVYPFRVWDELDTWPESTFRRRRWLNPEEAGHRLGGDRLRAIVARLPEVATASEEDEPTNRLLATEPLRLIYLFRHAKASREDPAGKDFDRPLTPRGIRDCETMSRYIAIADIRPHLVLSSAALRASQSVAGVIQALGDQAVVEYLHSLYLAGPLPMLKQLRRIDTDVNSVMLVGHNPGIQSLASWLVGSGDEAELARLHKKVPTGALATLVSRGRSWGDLDHGTCELHSLVRPRDIGTGRDARNRGKKKSGG